MITPVFVVRVSTGIAGPERTWPVASPRPAPEMVIAPDELATMYA